MEATNKEVIFTRPHKTIYATEDKIIKVFDNRYTKADVLNEARNEALVELNTDLNVPSLVSVEETPEGGGKDPAADDGRGAGKAGDLHGDVCRSAA